MSALRDRLATGAPWLAAGAAAIVLLCISGLPARAQDTGLSVQAQLQIQGLLTEKAARTPAQLKLDSQLVYALARRTNGVASRSAPLMGVGVEIAVDGSVLVDITGRVADELTDAIKRAGGVTVNAHAEYDAIRARLPLGALEELAVRKDVRFIEPAARAETNTGSVTSEGDVTHRAAAARTAFGLNGTGVNVGVLSDSSDFLANSQASNDLGAVTVLAGQSGVNTCGSTGTGPCTGEGTAIMEIIADIAPNANIFFATGNGGAANMAANIQALRAAGCNIIVDDLTYLSEFPFQDGPIAQAVNAVSAAGVMYFSSARNSGNLNDGTSGTWEGDFADGGAIGAPLPGAGRIHSFGASTFDSITAISARSNRADLFWSDALGASGNDYDLFVLDSAGNNVLQSSTNPQTGSQNPYEFVNNALAVGNRIVIVQRSGAAGRFLHLDTGRNRVSIGTAGNVRGHNASGAANAFSVAATDVANSNPSAFTGGATNPVETFSSDGPRRIFYDASGNALTPGNVSSTGGQVLNKPDITAADGVVTSLAGFNPFFGTSAAAPHAAAIAALLLSSTSPAFTLPQIRNALQGTALDIEAAGFDRDSGFGIVMPFAAYKSLNPCTLTCPGNIAKNNDPNVCGASASFAATTSGGCGTVTCTPPSGSFFPVGSTPVQCGTASEESCSFSVAVTDVQPPVITCPADISVECTGNCGTPASNPALVPFFTGVSATDNCAVANIANNAPSFFNLGTTPVTFTATDVNGRAAACQADVTVVDTIPPTISVTLDRTVLWPPNHKLVEISAVVTVADICDPHPTFVLTSIASNEPDNGTGDGDTANDIQNASYGTADTRFDLRSERSGPGSGRVYTIVYTASDKSGNTTPATVRVTVPHDQSGHSFSGAGFNGLGTGFQAKVKTFELVIVSSGDFDATLATSVQVGNTVGVINAWSTQSSDVNCDGFPDLVASFSVAAANQILSKSKADDTLGFRYVGDDKEGHYLPNIFDLGSPLSAMACAR